MMAFRLMDSGARRFKVKLPKSVSKDIQDVFGGRLHTLISGGAPIDGAILDFFCSVGFNAIQGYGLTECSPIVALNPAKRKYMKNSSAGHIMPFTECKILEPDSNGIGEIAFRGPQIMKGYYKDEENTKAVLDDEGWFHTGDIGKLVGGKYLKITDRKKEIFKLSSGKYIAPQVLETLLRESEYIDNAFVFGANEKFASAIILPAYAKLKAYADEHGIKAEKKEQLLENEKIMALLNQEVMVVNKKVADHENIKKPHFAFDEWTPDNGMLSQTLKPKRRNLNKRYAEVIANTYKTPA
jgi:long-chain acyl-CoA synthetase